MQVVDCNYDLIIEIRPFHGIVYVYAGKHGEYSKYVSEHPVVLFDKLLD